MDISSPWLLGYRRDTYSQAGEDGVMEKILEVIPDKDRWCVEFGAWDGQYLSNTANLIESKNYSAVLIEADKEKFQALHRNYSQRGNVIAINKFVGFGKTDNLDCILGTTRIPLKFDFLSIDIDGNDFHVWKSTLRYRPKVVAIEFNPTIPNQVKFVQPADPSINQGASLLSLVELGREKGYELVAVLPFNAFFVQKKYYQLFQLESNEPEVLRMNTDSITYLFSGYDGQIFLYGCRKLPWHGVELRESRVQALPRILRRYPSNYSIVEKGIFALFLLITNPRRLVKACLKMILWFTSSRGRERDQSG